MFRPPAGGLNSWMNPLNQRTMGFGRCSICCAPSITGARRRDVPGTIERGHFPVDRRSMLDDSQELSSTPDAFAQEKDKMPDFSLDLTNGPYAFFPPQFGLDDRFNGPNTTPMYSRA